jgi:acyl dehydratase
MTALSVQLHELPGLVGTRLPESAPRSITQGDIDRFAALTGDDQWIHVDPERAADQGGTVAHGFLLLGLVGGFWGDLLEVRGAARALNYGLDRVRFLAPVPVDSTVHAEGHVLDVTERPDGIRVAIALDILAGDERKPAVVATSIVLFQH